MDEEKNTFLQQFSFMKKQPYNQKYMFVVVERLIIKIEN